MGTLEFSAIYVGEDQVHLKHDGRKYSSNSDPFDFDYQGGYTRYTFYDLYGSVYVTAFGQVEGSGDIGDCHQGGGGGGRRRRESSICDDVVEIAREDYEKGAKAEGWSNG